MDVGSVSVVVSSIVGVVSWRTLVLVLLWLFVCMRYVRNCFGYWCPYVSFRLFFTHWVVALGIYVLHLQPTNNTSSTSQFWWNIHQHKSINYRQVIVVPLPPLQGREPRVAQVEAGAGSRWGLHTQPGHMPMPSLPAPRASNRG